MPKLESEQAVVVTRGPTLRWDAAGWGCVVDDAYHAFAVRELTAVAGSEQFGMTNSQVSVDNLKLVSQGMLGAVGGRRHGTALELRYVTEPRDGRPTRVRLFITGKSVGDASSEPPATTATETVQAACAALPDGYEWRPAEPADADPKFDSSATLVEVRRQEEVLPPLLHSVPAEFYYAAYPLQGDGSGWGQFLGMLARATEQVVVSLLFAPTALDQLEQRTIGAVTSQLGFYAAMRQEQSHRGMGYVQGDANAAAVLPVWEHYMQSLRRCLLVRMTVCGSTDAARATARGLAGALSASRTGGSRGGSPLTTQGIRSDRDRQWARHSWVMRDVVPWGGHPIWSDDGAPNTVRRLPYLYSLSEAAAAAMLPVPNEQGAQGFPRAQRKVSGRMARETRQVVVEVQGGVIVAGDQYNVGQAGAVGSGARARDMTFVTGPGMCGRDDPAALAAELEQLCAHLQADADDEERAAALSIVAQAERKARDGDGPAAIEQLSALRCRGSTGRWALAAATTIGTTVAAAALTAALGLS